MAISAVKAKINGTTYNLALNEETGAYEAVLTAPNTSSYNEQNHYYPIEVIATDNHGNSTIVNQADAEFGEQLRLYVTEETKPNISVIFPTDDSFITNNKPTISWTCEDDDSGVKQNSIALSIDNIEITSENLTILQSDKAFNCTCIPQGALSEGNHIFVFFCEDNDGNTQEKIISVKVDTIPPSLIVSSPAENLYTNVSPYTVSGYTNDSNESPVTLKVNGQSVAVGEDGYFSAQIELSDGDNTITVTATDGAGLSTTVQRMLNYNNIPPELSNISIAPNPALVASQVTISVTVTDE